MKSYFPDINVWIALTYSGHVHHQAAAAWLEGVSEPVYFCRFTQLGFLRLLTNTRVMGSHVRSQREAWEVYDRWSADSRVGFHAEPLRLETALRAFTQSLQPATAAWPDAYLAAVAKAAGLTLVTLDTGFRSFESLDALVLGI